MYCLIFNTWNGKEQEGCTNTLRFKNYLTANNYFKMLYKKYRKNLLKYTTVELIKDIFNSTSKEKQFFEVSVKYLGFNYSVCCSVIKTEMEETEE